MIKNYTSIEQSKKLAEILPLKSADMVYFGIHQGMDGKYYLSGTNTEDDVVPIYKNLCIKVFAKTTASDVINQLPCWSLTALLGLIKDYTLQTTNQGKVFLVAELGDKPYHIATMEYDEPVDSCVEMIEKLHENNLI